MANYINNTFFIKGTKQAVVDLLNLGLKRTKTGKRISIQMSGEEMVSFLNGMERCLQFSSFIPRPKTFDVYDTTNSMMDFVYWYANGCMGFPHYDNDMSKKRMTEIYEYIEAHLELFPPIEDKEEEKEKTDCDIFFEALEEQESKPTKVYNYPDYKSKALRMMHPELVKQYEKYVFGYKRAKAYQQLKYGVVGWYDWNCKNYGCKWSMNIEWWAVVKETDDCFCLSAYTETPWASPITFFDFLNKKEGITVYAYCFEPFAWACMYNGRTDEEIFKDASEEERYAEYEEKYKNSKDYDPEWMPYDVNDLIISDYIDGFKAEIAKEIGCEKV